MENNSDQLMRAAVGSEEVGKHINTEIPLVALLEALCDGVLQVSVGDLDRPMRAIGLWRCECIFIENQHRTRWKEHFLFGSVLREM